MDNDGPWGWTSARFWSRIYPKLAGFETMTWGDIKNGGSHHISIENIIKPARDRLEELRMNIDEVFSLRLSGRERIFGLRAGRLLKLLWWDPDHEIAPSNKKHT